MLEWAHAMTTERRPGQPTEGQQPFMGGKKAPQPVEPQATHGSPEAVRQPALRGDPMWDTRHEADPGLIASAESGPVFSEDVVAEIAHILDMKIDPARARDDAERVWQLDGPSLALTLIAYPPMASYTMLGHAAVHCRGKYET